VETAEKERFIKRSARRNRADPLRSRVLWSRHAIAKLADEAWVRSEVERGLEDCAVIEDYPALHRPLPDCLVLARLRSGELFHAVVAIDEDNDRIFIVTVYRPSSSEWEHDWKTRKR
jgi:hypothetical protein